MVLSARTEIVDGISALYLIHSAIVIITVRSMMILTIIINFDRDKMLGKYVFPF